GGALKLARVRREALIQEAELRTELVDILESLTDGFMALDEEWRIRYVNAAAEQTNAMARESLLGRTFWEAFPAALGTEIEQNLRRAMGARVQVSGEAYYEPDGRWYEMDIHPTRGRHLAFFGRDITERKRAEEIQRRLQRERDEALARLRRKFERMPIACILFDAQYRITDWNPAAEAMFGYRREEVLGKVGPEILVTPRVREESHDILRRLAAGDMDAHAVNENITKDGRTIVCEWHNTPVQDADGKVTSFVSMAQDITHRVEAEAALRESEERYRSLISQVSDYAIFSTDGLGIVRSWNEGCQQVLGYGEAEFIGLDVAKLFSPEDRAADLPAHQLREARGLGALRSHRWMQARDGRRFYGMGVTTALTGATGEPIGFSMILRDVTQMKLLQDERMRGEEELSQLVTQRTDELQWTTDRLRLSERMASLGTLSAGLGHDLGNLLLPMEIRLRLLLDSDMTPELRELVSGIEKGTQYLQRLAGGLRSLSLDPDASLEAAATELRAWLDDVAIILRNVLGRHISFEYGTPPAACWVGIKSVGLTQVVYNLVQNATDALRGREGGRVRLDIRDDPEVGAVLLRVSDNGPGMSPEVLQRCMEPYFSTKPRGVSTGMGLTFVHRLVTGVGGRMDIDSTVGQGTTISLTLLRAKPAEGVELPAEADLTSSGGGSSIQPGQW
ncbi:MAG TPA: PAS domain S-box protein, partial [Gemmatimonadales bacterium]